MKTPEFHNDVIERLTRIETNSSNTNKHLTRINGSVKEHADDISKLKQWKSYLTGAVAVISMVLLPVIFIFIRGLI